MSPTQLLFVRSCSSCIFLSLLMNRKIGHFMYSAIDPKYYGALAFRVSLQIAWLVCVYTSVKSLPLVYIALVSTLIPLLTALISYFFLKKGLNRLDVGVLIVSFAGVIVLILGAEGHDGEAINESDDEITAT